MKKSVLCFLILMAYVAKAQVGIGTNSPTSTLEVNGSFSIKTATITTDTTLNSSHALILCNNTTGITINLPSAAGISGRIYKIKTINTGTVTITASSGQKIDGGFILFLDTKYSVADFVSNGSNWFVLNKIIPTHNIGELYGGGVVFYLDGTGQHGLISALIDQAVSAEWGCFGTSNPGTQNAAVGTGQANTTLIVGNCATLNTAARICNNLILNTYNDWFLPSKDELNLMFVNLKMNGLGGFSDFPYWSSTQANEPFAPPYYYQQLAFGLQFPSGDWYAIGKDDYLSVRAVRAF
jgi:hypothetical protein